MLRKDFKATHSSSWMAGGGILGGREHGGADGKLGSSVGFERPTGLRGTCAADCWGCRSEAQEKSRLKSNPGSHQCVGECSALGERGGLGEWGQGGGSGLPRAVRT